MSKTYDESKLPKWAQERLAKLRQDVQLANDERDRMAQASVVLHNRNWFTITGPSEHSVTPDGLYRLWYMSHGGAHPACSLGRGDIVLVGRATDDHEAKRADKKAC